MKKLKLILLSVLASLSFAACTSVEDLGRFTVISSKNVDLSRLGEMQKFAGKSETKKYNARFLFIRYSKISDNYILENALDSALETIPGAVALVDAKVQYYKKTGFLGITGKWGYKFEGTALIDTDVVGEANLPSENETLFIIKDEASNEIAFVTESEFNEKLSEMSELAEL